MNFALYTTYIELCELLLEDKISNLKPILKHMFVFISNVFPFDINTSSIKLLFLSVVLCFTYKNGWSNKPNIAFKLGNGLTVTDADSSMSFYLGFVNQDRIEVNKTFIKKSKPIVSAQIQRLRLRTRATFFHQKLLFYLQLAFEPREVVKGRVLTDAYIRYTPVKYVSLQIGQANLPGNRESLTSAQNQQFIERSPTSSLFRSDKDFGIQVHGHFGKKMLVKPMFSVATGEGRSYTNASFQHFDYMTRIEWLPLGDFNSYNYVDFKQIDQPKLAIGVAYDFNNKAIFQNGQLGGNSIADSLQQNIHSVFADLNFKWKGVNINTDYIFRTVKNDTLNLYRKGHSLFTSIGYTFKKHYEIGFRYNHSFTGKTGNIDKINDYTFAFTKYFFEHNLKIQTDYTFSDNKSTKIKSGLWRLQVQIII